MSQIIFDIKTGIQDYIDATTDDFDAIVQTVRTTLVFFHQHTKQIRDFTCREIKSIPKIELVIEPEDDIGKIYNLQFFITTPVVTKVSYSKGVFSSIDPVKAYDRAMKGIG